MGIGVQERLKSWMREAQADAERDTEHLSEAELSCVVFAGGGATQQVLRSGICHEHFWDAVCDWGFGD